MGIGKRIKHYRDKLGWTLLQLSEASDVDVGTISALEQRDSNRSKYFVPISKAFGLTLEQLSDEGNSHYLNAKLYVVAGATPPKLSNPAQPVRWPFENVTIEQYDLLTPEDRRAIEDHIFLFVASRSPSEKKASPANQSR